MNVSPNEMTLDELLELQKTVTENLLKQKDKVIQDIIGKMTVMKITIPDLQEHLTPVVETKKRTPKYRNPANADETWTGNGKKPKWLVAYIENGGKIEECLINSD